MTNEERLNRLERVAKMLATSGRRARTGFNDRINALIDAQINHEDQFARAQARTVKIIWALAKSQKELVASHKELAESQKELAESQKITDKRLRKLIDIVARDRNGDLN
jgi:hypothetical protein